MRCTRHNLTNCILSLCRQERERRNSTESTSSDLTDPTSALYQATYGGYVDSSSSDSRGSCDTSSSDTSPSSCDSGSSNSGSSSCGDY